MENQEKVRVNGIDLGGGLSTLLPVGMVRGLESLPIRW